MPHTIFFSWQATRSQREGRSLIEDALKTAIANLANDLTLEEALREGLDLDKDTKNVPGNPPIFTTILGKIDKAAVFIPDLTSVAKRENGELIPNPNVLIEYGWALNSLGYHQIIPVMNTAYGDPKEEDLPFDMAHLRNPITYNLSESASNDDLRAVRASLAKVLENALKTVFESEEFKSSLPKPPAPPVFPRQDAQDGRARFMAKGKSLGVPRSRLMQLTGQPESSQLHLAEGAACWFRIMPAIDTGRRWLVQDLQEMTLELSIAPILNMSQSVGFVRGADGGGHYAVEGGDTTHSVAYVFKTGEIWIIDSWLAQIPQYVELNELAFTQTLEKCISFLSSRLQVPGPYFWEAGFEGIAGRMLVLREGNHRPWGTAVEDYVFDSGDFKLGDDAAESLRPFFEKVFDCFGARRPRRSF